jgi:hypothetical protein
VVALIVDMGSGPVLAQGKRVDGMGPIISCTVYIEKSRTTKLGHLARPGEVQQGKGGFFSRSNKGNLHVVVDSFSID